MDFWRSVGGMLEISITSADPEKLLTKVNQKNITLFNLRFTDTLTCICYIRRKDYSEMKKICSALDASMHAQAKSGLFWTGKQLLYRPVLVLSFLLLITFVLLIPTRVFFLRVEGNKIVPSKKILEAAETCGIQFGASRREVRSEKVKNALIGSVPELQWAGVNTKGCVATISVRERALLPEKEEKRFPGDVVAVTDGYILSSSATCGTLLVQPGQTVTAGQILISGYSDLGLVTKSTAADGEILAQTKRTMNAVSPSKWLLQKKTGSIRKKYSLLIGKKRINLWKDSGISGTTCGRMYEECYVTLPGNFVLPVALCIETFVPYALEYYQLENISPDSQMEVYVSACLQKQMVAGEIIGTETQWLQENGLLAMQMQCVCREMIGRFRQEQIGDIHE